MSTRNPRVRFYYDYISSNAYLAWLEIPRLAATNGYYSYEGAIGDALAPGAEDSVLRHKPALLIARNPCDIAVSWYFQFTKRQSAAKQELINHFVDTPIDKRTIGM